MHAQWACGGRWQRQGVRVADVQFEVVGEHAIGEQIAQVTLRLSVHNTPDCAMQVLARVDVMRETRARVERTVGDPSADRVISMGVFTGT